VVLWCCGVVVLWCCGVKVSGGKQSLELHLRPQSLQNMTNLRLKLSPM
jgi:hypothetical protein